MSADLIAFYSGTGADHRGRLITEMWDWPDEELERTHDYIQWLFPLREKSGFNVNAPVLDESIVGEFRKRADLKKNVRRSLERMLKFYGLRREASGVVCVTQTRGSADAGGIVYNERLRGWVSYGNHNHLRITRILKSLSEFWLEQEAKAFFQCLTQIYRQEEKEEGPGISAETFRFWQNAVEQK